MNRPWFQPFLAEAIGTFGLIFFGAGSIIMNEYTGGGVGLVGIALAHGVVLAVVITATAHISGGHINPAVTIGVWIGRKIEARMAVVYIAAQLLGAVVAAAFLAALFPAVAVDAASLGTPMLAGDVTIGTGIVIEAILTFFLVFTVFGTALDPRATKLGGWAIGLVLIFAVLAGGPLTGAALNPARAFGPALVSGYWTGHIVYWAGPILGGIVAAAIYSRLLMPRPDATEAATAAE